MSIYSKIKKQNGERFAKVLRDYHNGIFEIPNILNIVKHAGNSPKDAEQITAYLLSIMNKEEDEVVEVHKDPIGLLNEAGYNAWVVDSQSSQDSIKKYFSKGEELCTFGTARHQRYHIINAVKHDVDNIKRKDFKGVETRQDLYGTSVLSIQVAKSGGFISIKNRYNHAVSGCDNTFNSNPDNIISGLSASIQNMFGVSFSTNKTNLPDDVMLVNDCLFKFFYEINGIFYGNSAYIKNGEIVNVDPANHEYLFDYFIFNSQTGLFRLVDTSISDSFPEDFNRVYAERSLVVKKYCIWDGDVMLVGT